VEVRERAVGREEIGEENEEGEQAWKWREEAGVKEREESSAEIKRGDDARMGKRRRLCWRCGAGGGGSVSIAYAAAKQPVSAKKAWREA